jgi:two-component system, LytTR family, response regulator
MSSAPAFRPAISPVIRTAIVDDEPLGRMRLRELLAGELDIDIVGEFTGAVEAAKELAAIRPDLLFLDVEMPGGSAFTILDALEESQPATIFVTAHERYAVDAFGRSAVDYLVKPFDTERFGRSLQRVRHHLQPARGYPRPVPPEKRVSRLAIRSGDRVHIVRLDDLDWAETAGNYVRLHFGREAYLHRESLHHFESTLDPRRFVRIHRSTIVNIDRVQQLLPSFQRKFTLVLRDGTRLTLAPPYRRLLEALIGRF